MTRRAFGLLLAAAVTVLPAVPASACTGTVCDAINRVCSLGGGGGCLP